LKAKLEKTPTEPPNVAAYRTALITLTPRSLALATWTRPTDIAGSELKNKVLTCIAHLPAEIQHAAGILDD
jgi:hypothetical protein